jgi:DNA-binding LytR/AlgR family response regulator
MAPILGRPVMSGRQSGTGGRKAGISGLLRILPPWPLFAVIAGFLFAVIIVNISSHAIEDPEIALWQPALWEFSSYIAILMLVPLIYSGYGRFHWRPLGLPRFVALQAVCCLVFSLAHIALMVAMRVAGYALAGEVYDFVHGRLWLVLIYEVRKDAITFIVVMAIVWVDERLRAQKVTASPERLEVKTDGRTLYLEPEDIIFVEAAGNYVELHQTGKAQPLLLRGTLNEFEMRLKANDFVRVHRSRLINRRHIASHTGTSSGDLRITLADGRELAGSRRYRDNLVA